MSPPEGDPGPALLSPGTTLGKYSLLRRLAIGGMAEIYLARVSGLAGFEKLVVLKRILPQHSQHEDFIAMFLDEARIAATLHHPNIGQVFDIGHEGGSYFFTMEYIHGEDLRSLLRAAAKQKKAFGLHHAVLVVQSVAAGLHYAHEKLGPDGKPLHIVHRDVSPSNVIVTYDGQVKLVDFGIAKAASRQAESRAGIIKGKVSYMSPEQCQGKPLDRRSDVYALGILLYELSTGTRLYKGDNELAVLNQIVWEDVPPPSKRKPDYPAALERIVMRALAKSRDDRYATAQELQVDLETLSREHKLPISTVELGRWMEATFGKKEEPWHATGEFAGAIASETPPGVASAQAQRGESDSALVAAEQSTRPQRKRPWAAAIAAALFAAVVVAAVFWLQRSPGNRRASPSTEPPSDPPSGPPSSPVRPAASTPGAAPAAVPSGAAPPQPSPAAPPATPEAGATEPAAAAPPVETDPAPSKAVAKKPSRRAKPASTTKPDEPPSSKPKPKEPERDKTWDPDSPLLPP